MVATVGRQPNAVEPLNLPLLGTAAAGFSGFLGTSAVVPSNPSVLQSGEQYVLLAQLPCGIPLGSAPLVVAEAAP